MKNLKFIYVILLGIVCFLGSCQKETVYPTFPAPQWTAVDNPDFTVTMTIIAVIPSHLEAIAQSGDQLAAFVGDECRGVANKVGNMYYIMISGTENEASQVYFRYYGASTGYMYRTNTSVPFKADGMLGTAENPEMLLLEIIKE